MRWGVAPAACAAADNGRGDGPGGDGGGGSVMHAQSTCCICVYSSRYSLGTQVSTMYSASCKPRHDRGSGCTESIPYAHPHEYTHTQPRMRPGSLLPIRPSDGVTIADSISRSGPQISRLCWDCACFPPPCHPHSPQARSRIACYIT